MTADNCMCYFYLQQHLSGHIKGSLIKFKKLQLHNLQRYIFAGTQRHKRRCIINEMNNVKQQ